MAGSGLPPAGPWVDKWLSAFKQDLRRAQSSLLTIAELLHPDLADYLRITSVVADWLDLRPEPDR